MFHVPSDLGTWFSSGISHLTLLFIFQARVSPRDWPFLGKSRRIPGRSITFNAELETCIRWKRSVVEFRSTRTTAMTTMTSGLAFT